MIETQTPSQKLQMPDVIGVSSIVLACESMKHYHWAKVLEKREETPAMKEGTQLHMLVLEPEKFYATYCTDVSIPENITMLKTISDLKWFATSYGVTLKGKREECMTIVREVIKNLKLEKIQLYDDWIEGETRFKEFISKAKWEALHEMKNSILGHAFTKKYLANAKKEFPVEGVLDGQKIRGRVDWLVDDPSLPYVIVIDVKKTRCAKFFKFRHTVYDMWLFVQAALYSKMIEQLYNRPCLFVWMSVEGVAPYVAEAYSCNEAVLEAGLVHAKDALKRMHVAYDTDTWPGYSAGLVNNLDLPNYGFDKAADLDANLDDEKEAN